MKTKTVTIHNWDGSKYDVEAPEEANYIGIYAHAGALQFFSAKPRLSPDGAYRGHELADPNGEWVSCPDENRPCHDGYGSFGTVKKNGINVRMLLLKIEEV